MNENGTGLPHMKVTVPVNIDVITDENRETVLGILKEQQADEVYFTTGTADYEGNSHVIGRLKRFVPFLEQNGIHCALWITALYMLGYEGYQKITDIHGKESRLSCPLSRVYREVYCQGFRELLSSGIRKVVFDDDFRMHMPDDEMQCFCPEHMRLYGEYLGHPVTREEMAAQLLDTGSNEYRSAWLYGCQAALELFARALRKTADAVDPDIELLLCSGPSHFGADGTDAGILAEILAGKHTPISLRTIGAPYWQEGLHIVENMMSAVDFARHQALELKNRGIVPIAEGDPYPRPRCIVPASHLEFFHTIMLADGSHERMMKYILDYTSSPTYETGYYRLAHTEQYAEIEQMFSDKTPCGIHLYEPFDRVRHARYLASKPEHSVCVSAARQFLNDNSLPAVFTPGGVNLIFGENASCIDCALLKNGSILDLRAAEILLERGIDTGIIAVEDISLSESSFIEPYKEYYFRENELTALYGEPHAKRLMLSEGAAVLTEYRRRTERTIGSFLYENERGERFLVFNFDAERDMAVRGLFKSYMRQKQLAAAHEWLCGSSLDAFCPGYPGLYIMVKKNSISMTVGLWNFFADPMVKPVVTLSQSVASVRFLNGDGNAEGNKICFSSNVPAYTYAIAEVLFRKDDMEQNGTP